MKSIFFDQLNYSAVLFNFNESDGKITKLQLSRLLAELLEENDTLTVAVSSLKSREGIKELLIECLDILRFNETFYNGPIVTLADIGVFKNFIREEDVYKRQGTSDEMKPTLAPVKPRSAIKKCGNQVIMTKFA